jgi:hypothetical protein
VAPNTEEIVAKLRDAGAMLSAGKDMSAVVQTLEVSEATLARWASQYGGMKSANAKELKKLEKGNRRPRTPFGGSVLGQPGEHRSWSFSDRYLPPREERGR